jgi:GNAT superfamily N-acetyltransferase
MSVTITPVDPADDAAFAAWHHVYETSARHELGEVATPWQLEELRAMVQEAGSHSWSGAWSAVVDGDTVGAGWLRTPLLDNIELAELDVHVLPALRRRGIGTAVLARLDEEARSRGRRVLTGLSSWPYDAGSDAAGRRRPAVRAGRRRGPRPRGVHPALVERAGSRRPAAGVGRDHLDPRDRGADR